MSCLLKNLKLIYVLPRIVAEHDVDRSIGPYLLISICDHNFPTLIPKKSVPTATLRLQFIDWDATRADPQVLNETMFGQKVGDSLIQPAHAIQLRKFLEGNANATTIVVHCLAGISRSVSLGFAVCDAYGISRGALCIYSGRSPYGAAPNQSVYSTIFEGLRP